MPQFADRVKVTSTSTGTGAITLSSSAVSGYQAFPSSLDGETVGYVIESGSAWEIGTGTYTHSSLNLTRSLRSSSTGSLLSLASGTHTVFLTPAFQDIQIVEAFSSTSDLPAASDNHGRVYHVHGEGALYFAHSGSWVKLANYSDITTYSNATTSAAGLMSAADKTKLDGVETSADVTDTTNVVAALTAGTNITIAADGTISSTASGGITVQDEGTPLTATATTLNFAGAGVQATGTGATKTITISGSSISGTLTDPVKQTEFTGAVTNNFTVDYTVGSISVFLNGSKLAASDFTATNGTSVVLGSNCAASDIVTVVEYGTPFASPYSSTIFTVGTSSEYNTSTKVLTTNYTANKVAIYLNGVKLLSGTDYTASNGTTIDLTNSSPTTGDKIEVVEHGALADTVTTLTGLSDTPSSLGTAGQVLQVNSGATALEFADASSGSGVTTYTDKTAIDAVSSPSEGDLAYDLAADQLYIRTTSAWKRIYVGAQEDVVWTTELDSTYNFSVGASGTTLTVAASDPEGFPITYAHTTVPSSTNLATISQGTGANSNQFLVTPNNSSTAGTFTLRVTADDGVSKIKTVSSITIAPTTALLDLSTGTGGGNGTAVYTASGGAVITSPNNTYSSYYDMEHLFNGNTSSGLDYYWMTNGGTADYLEVDLSSHSVNSTAISYIGKIRVYPYVRSDTFTNITSVDVSSDGSTWTNVAGDQGMTSSNYGFGDYKEISINSYATYIRLGMSRIGNWGFSMHELEIYAG